MEYLTTPKIKKYVVAKALDSMYFEKEVNELIYLGYEPFESPFFANGWFHQAMVKYEED